MKKGKTFLTLLSLAGVITVITMTVANTMTTHLEPKSAPKATATPKASFVPTLPPSPSPLIPIQTPAPTPVPTPKKLHIVLPVAGAEVLSEYTEDVLVFQATYGDYRTHLGIDFGGEEGTPVYAV